jgi:NADP-dependent 3-hydroxy acid dehydrogenase YdfG
VAITGRDHDRLGRFAEERGEPAGLVLLAGDAADSTAVHAAVQATIHKCGRLDTVVANAGCAPTTPWPTATRADGARWS